MHSNLFGVTKRDNKVNPMNNVSAILQEVHKVNICMQMVEPDFYSHKQQLQYQKMDSKMVEMLEAIPGGLPAPFEITLKVEITAYCKVPTLHTRITCIFCIASVRKV